MILIEARIKFCGKPVTDNFFRKKIFFFKNFKNSNHSFIPVPGILGKFSKILKS